MNRLLVEESTQREWESYPTRRPRRGVGVEPRTELRERQEATDDTPLICWTEHIDAYLYPHCRCLRTGDNDYLWASVYD